ncbi:MAG: hypothetical protein HKN16_09070 [Saprospiraceae bacterium]|nr:hypothetical protein [Saprospiraceae bacterium]
MTLGTLLLYIAIAAVILTAIVVFGLKKEKSILMSFLQNYCGALFLFSGYVKAVDPLGTAYKMEQYFAEFESTFADTFLSFIAPIFPWLSNLSVSFSVGMIVFEMVLGIMLIIGSRPKVTSWAFFLLVGLFTILTGFTFLTGYVPSGVNFFDFGSWGPYVKTNMKVTDCGCFGDFIKLEPKTSFYKDIFLLFPSVYFLLKSKDMHRLFTSPIRNGILGASLVGLIVYCLSNYAWDIPNQDFRPFKVGTDVASTKVAEEDAAGAVQVVAYKLTNKTSGEIIELPYAEFLKKFKEFPKADWEYDQVQTEPTIEATKISDYAISDEEGIDITDSLLNYSGYSLMIVSHKLMGKSSTKMVERKIPVMQHDTVTMPDGSLQVVSKVAGETTVENPETTYKWDNRFANNYGEIVNPFCEAAEQAGLLVYGVAGGAGNSMIDDLRHATQAAYPIYQADDILLKTIVRSNPGIVLWKDGKILMKWHHRKLPSWDEVASQYVK